MGKAWLLGDPRRLVLATDIPENKTRWQTEHFRYEFCPAKVYPRFTPRTETSSGRRPHFARNPSSDADPNYHASECIYNVERIGDELIKRPKSSWSGRNVAGRSTACPGRRPFSTQKVLGAI